MSRVPWKHVSRYTLYSSCTFAGCSVAFGLFNQPQSKLHGDSNSKQQWPKTRPLIASTSAKSSPPHDDVKGEGTSPNSRAPIESSDEDVPLFEDEESSAWALFSSRFATARKSITSIQWSSLGDKIADQVLPEWASALPGYVAKLQKEVEMGPDSLAYEIWEEARDETLRPEIALAAQVRVSKDLCPDEKAFIRRRKQYTTRALSNYLHIPIHEIDPRDVPTIAISGSGGGLRALVAGTSSYLSAQEAGLFDVATYTAGVSGSCWLQALYYSNLCGRRHDGIIEHLKRRIGTHIAYPPSFLELLTRAPTNKYLLSGFIEKLKGDPDADFGIVDAYGLLLAARLLVPRDELGVDFRDLRLSNQRSYLADGQNPLPIYAAVRHEIPVEEVRNEDKNAKGKTTDAIKDRAKKEAWFQWFEFSPYELWCEELEAGIPSWSIGRHFSKGRSLVLEDGVSLPELGIPYMLGIWGSAFCATLAHYYKEVRPIIKGLAGFGGIDDLVEERNEDLIKLHPIHPGAVPNYALGLESQLPPSCPRSIHSDRYLELMDAGMSCNLPLYPLLRNGRDVDIIVCFDASADIKQENWLSVADGYAKQRGVKGWPYGAGWPKTKDETKKELDAADSITAQQAAGKIADAREQQRTSRNLTRDATTRSKDSHPDENDLGFCNVWVGNTTDRRSENEMPQSRMDHRTEWKLLEPDAGIAVIYFPFLPNPEVQGVDPNTSDFMSTWNFIYTPAEIDKVVALARANFKAGEDQTKRTVRAVYERKKAKRLEMEEKERSRQWKKHLRDAGNHFQ